MPANFTRRRDLFADAGFSDVPAVLLTIKQAIAELPMVSGWTDTWRAGGCDGLRSAIAQRVAAAPNDQQQLARLVPEWLTERNGDLATALWLTRAEHATNLDLPGFLLTIFDALLQSNRERDALAFARFVLDLGFDWSHVYGDTSLAYEFLKEREPNPLVWRLLEEFTQRNQRLHIVELGCGRGNDAFGFLNSSLVDAYVGIDLVQAALDTFQQRVLDDKPRLQPSFERGDFTSVLQNPTPPMRGANLVYSYSSLHYFSSTELRRIFALVRDLLRLRLPEPGYFAFAIKGAGSVWHGQGLPLYRPDVWVNWDGQSRWFPSKHALAQELDLAGFEIHFHELHDHWGYSEHGKRDVFHYVLCSPRAI